MYMYIQYIYAQSNQTTTSDRTNRSLSIALSQNSLQSHLTDGATNPGNKTGRAASHCDWLTLVDPGGDVAGRRAETHVEDEDARHQRAAIGW